MPSIQIIATIGPSSKDISTIARMADAGMSIARLNFSWGTHAEHGDFVKSVRLIAAERGIVIPIIQDLSGPRIQGSEGHTFDPHSSVITPKDVADLSFTLEHRPEYVALSFVRNAEDVLELRTLLSERSIDAKIIAKIERKEALEALDEIIDAADGIMVARGDLGEAIPYETVPFVKKDILKRCSEKKTPAVVATEMLTSMTEDVDPSRADISDIAQAILDGASATMLSNETAMGDFPVEAIAVMRTVVDEALLRASAPSAYRF
jgi:pyruvate kinase